MPRKLDARAAKQFIDRYRTAERCAECDSGELGVTVWDHYGTVPADAGGDAGKGAGLYIGAVVACENCGHGVTLDRARLDAHQAA